MFEHRLLLLTEAFPPSLGGIQSYLGGLMSALPRESSFVVAGQGSSGDRAWDARQAFPIRRVPTRTWAYPRWRAAWASARALVKENDIEVIVCGKALFEGRAAIRLQEEFGLPYVVCTYALEVEEWLKGRKTAKDLRAVLRGAARVLVIHEETKRLLRALGVAEEALVKLYPGVAEEFFGVPDNLQEFFRRFTLDGKRVLVSVARLVPRKGHDVLLQALPRVLRAVPEVHLLLIGDGPERDRLVARARTEGLFSSVTFLGAVETSDLRRALALAEVFVLTPRDLKEDPEGFGIAYLEAAAAGVPSVASRAGGVAEAVQDGVTGILVPPDDPEATSLALVRLLTDDALRERLGAAARARAAKDFHWKGRAFLFQGMIHALLQGTGEPRVTT